MPTSFPTTYDALTNPTAGSLLTSPSHSGQHSDLNDSVEAIEQRIGLSGTAFPGAPSAGQFFHRTDRRLNYYYDGTRWLTTTLYEIPIGVTGGALPFAATVTGNRVMIPHAGVHDLWLLTFQATFFVSGGTALGASHKWACTLSKTPPGTVVATFNIDSGASSTWRTSGQIAINALVGVTNFGFDMASTKTGTPGDLYVLPTVTYRLVG